MTIKGPQNDMWSFELSYLQWRLETTTGTIPPPMQNFGFTKTILQGRLKFIIFAGDLLFANTNHTYM